MLVYAFIVTIWWLKENGICTRNGIICLLFVCCTVFPSLRFHFPFVKINNFYFIMKIIILRSHEIYNTLTLLAYSICMHAYATGSMAG